MGFKHTAPALQAPGLTTTDRAVLALVADLANADKADTMWHSQEHLADRLEISREAVNRALSRSAKLGYISKTPRYRTTPDGARRTTDTIQVHHKKIQAAYDAKLADLHKTWEARGNPAPEGHQAGNLRTSDPMRDDKSHSYVTTDHMARDEKSQQNREGNQEGNQEVKTPYAATATPAASTREAIEDEQETNTRKPSTDRWAGKRDHHGKLYESVVKGALVTWAHYRVHGDELEEQQARDYVLATFRERNNDEFADWAEEFGGFSRKRAQQILEAYKADGEDGARYEAGAIYGEMMNAASVDPFHPADVENAPRVHRQEPLYVVTREEVLGTLPQNPAADEQPEDVFEAGEHPLADQSARLAPLIEQQEAEEDARRQKAERDARHAAWEAQFQSWDQENEAEYTPTPQEQDEAREMWAHEEPFPTPEQRAANAAFLASEPIDFDAEMIPEEYHQEALRVLYPLPEPRQEPAGTLSSSQDDREHPQAKNVSRLPENNPYGIPAEDYVPSWVAFDVNAPRTA